MTAAPTTVPQIEVEAEAPPLTVVPNPPADREDVQSLLEDLVGNLSSFSREGTAERLGLILEVLRSQRNAGSSAPPSEDEDDNTERAAITFVKAQTAFLKRNEVATEPQRGKARLLAADDNEHSRDLLAMTLEAEGHDVVVAADGLQAWNAIQREDFDLVLLDIEMPRMSGFDVLKAMRENDRFRHVPVIVISGMDEMESVVTCIEMGAEDHLPKPFNHSLLKARIDASLEKKRLSDVEREHLVQIRHEQEISEALLLNVLPRKIAGRLKEGESPIADHFDNATVLFADLVGFTELSAKMSPSDLVDMLNLVFTDFDHLAEKYSLEKIKTIGDSYMVAGGLPDPCDDHAEKVAEMAMDMQEVIARKAATIAPGLKVRIGINSGPVVAGVIGRNKFIYDLWGDTVNVASRMESHGAPGLIQVSEPTARLLEARYQLESRGVIEVKGKGAMPTFILQGMK